MEKDGEPYKVIRGVRAQTVLSWLVGIVFLFLGKRKLSGIE